MTSIWRYSQAEGNSLLILLALGDWSDDEGYCFPSHRAIAEKTKASISTVKRAIHEHLASGELEKVAAKGHTVPMPREFVGRTGFRPTNLYRVTLVDKLGSKRPEFRRSNSVQPDELTLFKKEGQLGSNARSHIRNKPSEDTSEDTSAAAPPAPDPVEAFRLAWNTLTTEPITRCHSLTPKRRRLIRACLVERPITVWCDIFTRIEQSSFLHTNERGWVSLDWLTGGPDAALKVLEGRYQDRAPRLAGAPRLPNAKEAYGEWDCPHTPHCGHPTPCRTLLDIEQAKKKASA